MKTVLVLAAGKATRLKGLRETYAKACVPVGGTTPLGFLLPQLHAAGVRRAVINLHYKPEQVERTAREAAPAGLELAFLRERTLLGTGGTFLAVAEGYGVPDLVVNAKIFADLGFDQILAAPAPAVVLHPGSDLGVFGGFTHRAGRITGLRPAGPPAREPGAAVFTGVCRPGPGWVAPLRQAMLDHRPPHCLVRDGLLPALALGQEVRALLHDGAWCEISTPARVREAERLVDALGGGAAEALFLDST